MVADIETSASGATVDTIVDLHAALYLERQIVPRSKISTADLDDIF